jgi:hypothetical protein
MGLLYLMGESAFNPRELFSNSEQGLWLDPSDFSTMWQDAAGNTPVTAASDPVALILDKSRSGPSMGSNQVTNGGFGADSDWTKGTGWTIGSGVATKTAGSASLLSQAQTMTAGRYYIVTYTITRTAGSITPQFAGGSTVSGTARSTSGTFTDIMTAAGLNNAFQFSADASFAGTVDNVSLKQLSAGNHAYQTTSASRPTLQTTGGLWYLSFDGSDDSLITNAVDFSATDEMTVIAGVRKIVDNAAYTVICELSAATGLNLGSFVLAPNVNTYEFFSYGNVLASASASGFTAPVSNVVSAAADISADSIIVRANATQVAQSSNNQGTGNYGNHILYIGRRGGSSLPFNGHIYQLIVRGKTTPTGKLLEAERFVGRKTGVSF